MSLSPNEYVSVIIFLLIVVITLPYFSELFFQKLADKLDKWS